MANPTRSAQGFVPQNGWHAYMDRLEVVQLTAGTVLGRGDLVSLSGTGNTSGKNASVARIAAVTGAPSHLFYGSQEVEENDTQHYYDGVSAVLGLALRVTPDMIFEIMEDADGGALDQDNIGNVADIATVTDASSATGRSSMVIDSSSAATGASKLMVLLNIARYINNEEGEYALWNVKLNELQLDTEFEGV